MKKNRNYLGEAATTTSKDWGFIPVSGKGGKTTNFDETLSVKEIRIKIYGKKEGIENA